MKKLVVAIAVALTSTAAVAESNDAYYKRLVALQRDQIEIFRRTARPTDKDVAQLKANSRKMDQLLRDFDAELARRATVTHSPTPTVVYAAPVEYPRPDDYYCVETRIDRDRKETSCFKR
jgi:hypothetical protein